MMLGEMGFDTIFHTHRHDTSDTTAVHFEGTTLALYFVFLIMMSIIMMKLLTALAITDVVELEQNSLYKMRVMQLALAVAWDRLIPNCLRSCFSYPTKHTIEVLLQCRCKIVKQFFRFFDGPLYLGDIGKDAVAIEKQMVGRDKKTGLRRVRNDRQLLKDIRHNTDKMVEIEAKLDKVIFQLNKLTEK
jgi:hypothetical protein